MDDEITRRAAILAGVTGVVGIVVGAAAEYLSRPASPEQTLTTTVTSAEQSHTRTGKVTLASAGAGGMLFYNVLQSDTVENMKRIGYSAELALLGGRAALDSFISGQSQLIDVGPSTIMPAIEQGLDAIQVAPSTPLGFVFISSSNLTSLTDLVGKTIGISKPGALDDMLARYILRAAGIDLDKVTWAAVGASQQRVPALLSGKIDASMLIADNAVQALSASNGALHVLASVNDIEPGLVPDTEGTFAHRDWAANNPNVVKDFLKARIAAELGAVSDKGGFIARAAQAMLQSTDNKSVQFVTEVYNLYRSKGSLPYLFTDLDSVKLQLGMAKEAGTIKGTVGSEQILEPKYIFEVIQELAGS